MRNFTRTYVSNMMTSSNGNIFRVTGHLCGEFTSPGEFPPQRPVTRSFDVFFDLRLNKRLSKQSWGWWFETQSHPLWRQCNEITIIMPRYWKFDVGKFTNKNITKICQARYMFIGDERSKRMTIIILKTNCLWGFIGTKCALRCYMIWSHKNQIQRL